MFRNSRMPPLLQLLFVLTLVLLPGHSGRVHAQLDLYSPGMIVVGTASPMPFGETCPRLMVNACVFG